MGPNSVMHKISYINSRAGFTLNTVSSLLYLLATVDDLIPRSDCGRLQGSSCQRYSH
jgi:hypothetical protein